MTYANSIAAHSRVGSALTLLLHGENLLEGHSSDVDATPILLLLHYCCLLESNTERERERERERENERQTYRQADRQSDTVTVTDTDADTDTTFHTYTVDYRSMPAD